MKNLYKFQNVNQKHRIPVLLIFLFVTTCLTAQTAKQDLKNPDLRNTKFTLYTTDFQPFTQNDIIKDKHTLLYYVNPSCNFCHDQTLWLFENIKDMDDINIYIVVSSNKKTFERFLKRYKFSQYQNIQILWDKDDKFDKIFKVDAFPYMLLYDKEEKFIAGFKGLTEMYYINRAFSSLK